MNDYFQQFIGGGEGEQLKNLVYSEQLSALVASLYR